MVELVDHMRLRRAETGCERRKLARGQILAADRQHLAGVEGLLDLRERGVGQRLRKSTSTSTPKPGESARVANIVASYLRNSGLISCGRNNGISGQMINAASTSSIGTSMIIVSFSA